MRILASSLRRSIPYFFLKLLLASIILKLSMLVICGNPVISRNLCDPPKTTKVSAIPPKHTAKKPAASRQQPAASRHQPDTHTQHPDTPFEYPRHTNHN